MRASLFLLFFILLLPLASSGQKVGLVLSGGGAKGLYHVGVMRALEERNIPIDYVAGTSMGAIIGGLYATGYTPDQIGRILSSPDVGNWVSGRIDRHYKYYFKQLRPNAAMITLGLDRRKRGSLVTQLPSNLVQTDQLDLAFIDFFAASDVVSGGDFDRLMVPFRCVATDARNRHAAVFRDGRLGEALRASMSIPLLFEPVRTDSALYYDGGLYDNFPWRPLMQDFAPDILIGSACTGAELHGDNLMEQALALTMIHTDYTLPRSTDIGIMRSFIEISMLDFGKADYLMQRGYDDAMEQMERIEASIERRTDSAELAARRAAFRRSLPPLLLDTITIAGLTDGQRDYIRNMLRIESEDMPVPYTRFRDEYLKILAAGEVEGSCYPRVSPNPATGRFSLEMGMKTRPSLKLMFGGNLSSTALNQLYAGVEYKRLGRTARVHGFEGYFSPFYSSWNLNNRFDFFWRIPLFAEVGTSTNFYNYFRSNYGFLQKGRDMTYSKYHDSYATAAIGMAASRHSVLNLRLNFGRNEYLYYLKPAWQENDPMDRTLFNFMSAKLEYERSNTNYKLYPTSGVFQQASLIWVEGLEAFVSSEDLAASSGKERWATASTRRWFGAKFAREQYLRKWTPWFSMGYMVEGVLAPRPGFENQYASNISAPAFQPTRHSHIVYLKEFRTDIYAAGGLMPIFHFGDNFYLKTSAYLFTPHRRHKDRGNAELRPRYIVDASLVYQTFLGPVSLSLSQYDTSGNNWFLTFNFGTALFNRKGIFY